MTTKVRKAHNFIDLTGRKFARLKVEGYAGRTPAGQSTWNCECRCGGKVEGITTDRLLSGHTQSCGCLQRERAAEGGRKNRKNGLSRTQYYRVHREMLERCNNPRNKCYSMYGGRGITVCERWSGVGGLENFMADMGPKPHPSYTIDRFPDTNGNYEPTNCRWATQSQQARNRRSNRVLTLAGKTMLVIEWAEATGISRKVISTRLQKLGWSVERTLRTPVRPLKRK